VTEIFTEGDDIECFDSVDEARDKIRFYLKNDSARIRIADKSYQLVVHGGHTYVDRARQILDWVAEDQN
jgi:spore maturation protein CgeB